MWNNYESIKGTETISDPSGKILEEVNSKIGESGWSWASSIWWALAWNSKSVVRVVKHSWVSQDEDWDSSNLWKKELIKEIIQDIEEYNLKQKEEKDKVDINALKLDTE